MVLSEEQAILFYDLWIPLLDYVNRKYNLCKNYYGMSSPKGLPLDIVMKISSKLWENVSVIDEYLEHQADTMSDEEFSIVESWKKAVQGKFVVERHLKNGSILISCEEDGNVYKVRGIYSSWREMLESFPMPQIVEATLIPFQGIIIHDGLVKPYGICLGKNMADQAKQMYLNAKKENRIKESI